MSVLQSAEQTALYRQYIWALADKNDFEAMIAYLAENGLKEANFGDALFSLAKQAIAEQRLGTGRTILQFLLEAIEDKSKVPLFIKMIGDLYRAEKNYSLAREYYGKLPPDLENIKFCLQTFLPELDLDGILSVRNQLLTLMPATIHRQIQDLVDGVIKTAIADNPEIENEHRARYEMNLKFLAQYAPDLTDNPLFQDSLIDEPLSFWEPFSLKVAGVFYGKQNGIWSKAVFPPDNARLARECLNKEKNILIRCPTLASCVEFIEALAAVGKKFFRYECLVVLDFQILKQAMAVCDLSLIADCAFVIRFLDENNLEVSLQDVLLEKKVFFPSILIDHLGHNRHYYEQYVTPLLKQCGQKVLYDIDYYKKQLTLLYPANFHQKVIDKIKKGKKLKVLFKTSRYTTYLQYSIRDMAEGFRLLGHDVFIECENENAGYSIREDVKLRNLCEFRPDIIFCIDHLRYEEPNIPRVIPYVTWVQDMLPNIVSIDNSKLITANDYIFSFSKKWIDTSFKVHKVLKEKKIHILPVVASMRIYRTLPATKKIYDVTSVTHLPDPSNTLYPMAMKELFPEKLSSSELLVIRNIVDKMGKSSLAQLRKLQLHTNARKDLVEKICKNFGIEVTDNLLLLVDWHNRQNCPTPFFNHFMMLMKVKPVWHLLENGINVKAFGNNWEKYSMVQQASGGIIKNGTELNKLFNQSRINLNTSPGTTYHMKAPEVIASKNFMLTCKIPITFDSMPIEYFFEKDKEVILFDDEKDLLAKVVFFLEHPANRRKVSSAAHEKYIKNFSCRASALYVLDCIAEL